MTDSMRDRIERELGKDRLHELDKPVFGGRQLSDKQIEGIADAVLDVLRDLPDDVIERAAEGLHDAAFGQELPEAPIDLARAAFRAAFGGEQGDE